MPFANPVRLTAIAAKLCSRQAWRAKQALGGGHVSAVAFKLIIEALCQITGIGTARYMPRLRFLRFSKMMRRALVSIRFGVSASTSEMRAPV